MWLHHSACSSGSSPFFLRLKTVILLLVSRADHFLTFSPAEALRARMGRQDLGTGDWTEYSKLVIILILLHLIACSSSVGWQLLSLDRAEKKLAQWRSNRQSMLCKKNKQTSTCSSLKHQIHSYNILSEEYSCLHKMIRFSFCMSNCTYNVSKCAFIPK